MHQGSEEDGGGGGGVGALEEIENKELFDEVCRMFNFFADLLQMSVTNPTENGLNSDTQVFGR